MTGIAALVDQCPGLTDEQIAVRVCGIALDKKKENEATHETSPESEEDPWVGLIKHRQRECDTEECDLWCEQSSEECPLHRSLHVYVCPKRGRAGPAWSLW